MANRPAALAAVATRCSNVPRTAGSEQAMMCCSSSADTSTPRVRKTNSNALASPLPRRAVLLVRAAPPVPQDSAPTAQTPAGQSEAATNSQAPPFPSAAQSAGPSALHRFRRTSQSCPSTPRGRAPQAPQRRVTDDRAHPLLDLSPQHYVGDCSFCLDDDQKVVVGLVASLRILHLAAARVRAEQNQYANGRALTRHRNDGGDLAELALLVLRKLVDGGLH